MQRTSINDLQSLFLQMGLKKNQIVLIHTSLISLGIIEKGVEGVYEALRNILGLEATIIVPTFTYSFRKKETFDINNTPSPKQLGPFCEFIRNLKKSERSHDPLFSFCANGPMSNLIMKKKSKNCFGQGSVFDNFYKHKIKILALGLNYSTGITSFIHIEKLSKVPYREDKTFNGISIDNNGVKHKDYAIHFIKNEKFFRTNTSCRENIGHLLEEQKISKPQNFGSGRHLLIDFSDMVSSTLEVLEKNPYCMLKKI
jgi:aminoglycoside 3-N-acetyltransferase